MRASFDIEKKLEMILRLLENLASESAKGVPIIVEGRKDIEALNKLEIKGTIIAAKTEGKNLLDVLNEVEEHGKNEVILLMDFDRRGREMMKYLMQCLEEMKTKPNTIFWKEFSSLLKGDIKDIEGLSTFIKTLKRKVGRNIE